MIRLFLLICHATFGCPANRKRIDPSWRGWGGVTWVCDCGRRDVGKKRKGKGSKNKGTKKGGRK